MISFLFEKSGTMFIEVMQKLWDFIFGLGKFGIMFIEIMQKLWDCIFKVSLSDVIAFFALIISIIALIVQIYLERKNQKRNGYVTTNS